MVCHIPCSRILMDSVNNVVTFHCFIGKEINFEKRVSSPSLTTQSVPYDYESIMHYSAYAFSRNGFLTIDPHSSIIASKLGQRNGFSRRDIQHISILYCNGMCVDDPCMDAFMLFNEASKPHHNYVVVQFESQLCVVIDYT